MLTGSGAGAGGLLASGGEEIDALRGEGGN